MTSALHSAPLQSAMSYFNTLLTQPDPGLQKPLPNAPSAPVTIAQPPSSKTSGTVKDPTNAFNSLLAASPPTNPPLDLCEVCMLMNNLFAVEYSSIHSLVMLEQSITMAQKPTISARNDAQLPRRTKSTELRLENPAKAQLLQEIATYNSSSFAILNIVSQ
jgi:hypothetical protein